MNTGNAGKGRPKGATNKVTKDLKDMILGALDDAGGQQYLAKQANENPVAFMGLVGKCLPKNIEATHVVSQMSDEELDRKIKELMNE